MVILPPGVFGALGVLDDDVFLGRGDLDPGEAFGAEEALALVGDGVPGPLEEVDEGAVLGGLLYLRGLRLRGGAGLARGRGARDRRQPGPEDQCSGDRADPEGSHRALLREMGAGGGTTLDVVSLQTLQVFARE